MKSFLLKLTGSALIFSGLIYWLSKTPLLNDFMGFTWLSLGFLYLATLLVFTIIHYSLKLKDNNRFMMAFAIAIATKFMLSLIFLSYFIFIAPIQNKNFIFPFFAIYFAFTFLMIWEIFSTRRSLT